MEDTRSGDQGKGGCGHSSDRGRGGGARQTDTDRSGDSLTTCLTCGEECWDSRSLFRHLLRPSCQAKLGCTLQQFKKKWYNRVQREVRI